MKKEEQELLQLAEESYSLQEVANLLQTHFGVIYTWVLLRKVLGFQIDKVWKLPKFQFDKSQLVRGIHHLIPLISEDISPVDIWLWFTQPHSSLSHERRLSPLQWLQEGKSITKLITLIPTIENKQGKR